MSRLVSSAAKPRRTARQTELFNQLVSLFLAEGFADFTMDGAAARLMCSKSTIYALASSREQLIKAVVVFFFNRAAEEVEREVARETDPGERIAAYLRGVGGQLRAASTAFMDDIAACPTASEAYGQNTRIAAARVRAMIDEGVQQGAFRPVPAAFVAEVVSSVMVDIQQGHYAESITLTDAEAYDALSALVLKGVSA